MAFLPLRPFVSFNEEIDSKANAMEDLMVSAVKTLVVSYCSPVDTGNKASVSHDTESLTMGKAITDMVRVFAGMLMDVWFTY